MSLVKYLDVRFAIPFPSKFSRTAIVAVPMTGVASPADYCGVCGCNLTDPDRHEFGPVEYRYLLQERDFDRLPSDFSYSLTICSECKEHLEWLATESDQHAPTDSQGGRAYHELMNILDEIPPETVFIGREY